MKYKIQAMFSLIGMLFIMIVYSILLFLLAIFIMPIGLIFWDREDYFEVANHFFSVCKIED